MNTENYLQRAAAATQRAFYRLASLLAGLSFWQFVLMSIILLVAAGIAGDIWDKPTKRRISVTADVGSDPENPAAKRKKGAWDKTGDTAEIRIDEDGVVIRRKRRQDATPEGPPQLPQDVSPPATPPVPGKPATAGGAPDADVRVTHEDIEQVVRSKGRSNLPMIALLLILGLFVMRLFARANVRAEQRADTAQANTDREALQRQLVEARLQLLQAQVEPHFLFNTLAAVEHLIETAPARAGQMQRHLIAYLRAALPRMRQQSATLGQEVDLCASYLKIMQMRMEERLKFEVTVPSGLASASLPPMLLQSLVENSIRHGLEPKSDGGSVVLSAEVRDGKLCVTVADTGLGFSTAAGTGIGLTNIRERLQQLFTGNGALIIEPNTPCGARVTISIPYAVA